MWVYYNNPGGIKVNGTYHKYASKDEGYQALESLLWNRYVKVYGYDIKAIRDVYCQCGPEDLPKFLEIYNGILDKLNRGDGI